MVLVHSFAKYPEVLCFNALCYAGLASDPVEKGEEETAAAEDEVGGKEGKASAAEDTTSAEAEAEAEADLGQHEDGPGKDKPGLTDGQASDLEALLALSQALTGLDKLEGWSDLETHRDVSRCEGIEVDKESGRVTELDLHYMGLSGGHVQCKGHASCACCSTDQPFTVCPLPPQGVCLLNWGS